MWLNFPPNYWLQNLELLKRVVEFEILADIRRKGTDEVDDAINYANLHCYDVRVSLGLEGDWLYEVYIHEADPNAIRLHEYVRNRLHQRGFKPVEVITEW